jgi:cytochrome c oxidase assembly protein subunit 15
MKTNYDKFLQIFSVGSLCVLFSLMTLGGYVSSSGVGLSCPQWPLCPQGLIPSYEFIIEYIHRTLAATTGLVVFLTMAFVLRGRNSLKSTKIFSVIAAAAVVGQITLGAIVINEKLHADLVTAHLALGLILFSSMIYVVINIFYTNQKLKSQNPANLSTPDHPSNVNL